MKRGRNVWQILIGLSSKEEQIEGLKYLYDYIQKNNFEMPIVQMIPSPLMALPVELRDQAPGTTSFRIDTLQDYLDIQEAAPFDVAWCDFHLSSPDALNSTINAVKAGSTRVGEFSQFMWDHPGFDDDVQRIVDMVKSLGIIASKRDEYFCVETYLDDGFPGFFLDCSSYLAYALLEHYITTTLCGARYSISYGALLGDGRQRMALALAFADTMATPDQPIMSFANCTTIKQWANHIEANYGITTSEFLLEMLVERKYRVGITCNPVAVTEALHAPTVQGLCDILGAGMRLEEELDQWDSLMDFTELEEMRDVIIEKGTKMFHNILNGFKEAGVDIEDPVEMILVMKNYNPVRFEQDFHESNNEFGKFKPYYPTVLGSRTIEEKDKMIEELEKYDYKDCLKGKKVVVASADTHTYGLNFVDGVMKYTGAEVINAGLDIAPAELLDVADEDGTKYIGISVHNGQALDYSKQLQELAKQRGKEYVVFMGGQLNGVLGGAGDIVDVTDLVNETGVFASNDIRASIDHLRKD